MSEKDPYQKLIERHEKFLFGAPGLELLYELFEVLFTPEDAELLSKIPFMPYKAKYLSKKMKIPVEELTEKLDDFARRGVVFRFQEGNVVKYSNGDLILLFLRTPWWTGVDNELNINRERKK